MKKSNIFFIIGLLAVICFAICSCGGGGGGGGGTIPQVPITGSVQGFVYIPYGSAPARIAADTTGYKPYTGANILVTCGSTTKTGTSGGNGFFRISSLPIGACTVSIQLSGYITQQSQVTVSANQTATVGSTDGIKMTPSTHGAIVVSANVAGGTIILDSENTGIVIPTGLSYTLPYIKPGTHTVNITKPGFDVLTTQNVTVSAGATANVNFTMNPTGNHAPVANAGPDGKTYIGIHYTYQFLNGDISDYTPHQNSYMLDGSGSSDADSNILTYHWEQTSGPTVTLTNANASKTIFIPTQAGTYSFKLTVNDGYLISDPDYVSVIANKISGKIVFSIGGLGYGSDEILTINADGTELRRLTRNNYYDGYPIWSPDGIKILFTTNPSRDEQTYYPAMMNTDGSNVNVLPTQGMAKDFSPNGNNILVVKKAGIADEIFEYGTDGLNGHQLTSAGKKSFFDVHYSADGSKILFTIWYSHDGVDVGLMNRDGTDYRLLTNDNLTHMDAIWMPDGRILYTTATCIGCTDQLYVMNADGTGSRKLTIPSGINYVNIPVMTNDGQYIIFSDLNYYLHIICADGSVDYKLGIYSGSQNYNTNP
ncbi:MAG: carboxypeptidase regulatory-like domain-containing protein [bacterium]